MGSEKRKTLSLKVKLPALKSLKDLTTKLTANSRDAFMLKYGNILDLLFIDVQVEAITALAQFYDPPMRCFLFQDFQLAPTLEEFEGIVGIPPKGKGPYVEIGHHPGVEELAKALNIGVTEFASNIKTKGNVPGLLQSYLEEKAREFAASRNMRSFHNVLALLIYGLVLFPSTENFIDFTAISVFWGVLTKNQDPIPALLADVYYTLHMRHKGEGRQIICCLPLLYQWFMSHMCKDQSQMNRMNGYEWSQLLASLTEDTIRWYPMRLDVKEIIISCGEFPNVPLIGSKACISYNPILALRQLGRPMWEKPEEESLECLVLHNMGVNDSTMLQRIIRAWGKVNKSSGWKRKALIPPGSPEPIPISIEEIDQFKAAIQQLNKEKEELQASLLKATQENCELKREGIQKDKVIGDIGERLRLEEGEILKLRGCLGGANSQLKKKNQERDEILHKAYKLKEYWEKSQGEGSKLREELEEAKQEFHSMANKYEGYAMREKLQKEAMERALTRSQFELRKEQENLEEIKKFIDQQGEAYETVKKAKEVWEHRYLNLVDAVESGTLFQILRREGAHWENMFSKLAVLANNVIETIPTKLEDADAAMHPLNTPSEVFVFVEFCKIMIKDFREKIRAN
ncbi:hypothetical protein TSUD_416110 [Trifolium subterraneum]|uniref:DUF7745 domain-containing protein n=1 Tax=Trifolium subterraneum TaxID=3900 RepID=A0A2Z6PLF2_TRISU|nr:hypothetical protein TSUD_416110 [Trifolium subterraneum]